MMTVGENNAGEKRTTGSDTDEAESVRDCQGEDGRWPSKESGVRVRIESVTQASTDHLDHRAPTHALDRSSPSSLLLRVCDDLTRLLTGATVTETGSRRRLLRIWLSLRILLLLWRHLRLLLLRLLSLGLHLLLRLLRLLRQLLLLLLRLRGLHLLLRLLHLRRLW
jgi:hypothetical protein